MYFKVLLCVIACAVTISAQPPTFTPPPFKPQPVTVAVSPDGQRLAIARGNNGNSKRYGRVEVWNLGTGELERIITGFDGPVWSLTFSRDGQEIITASTEYRQAKIQSSVKDLDAEKITGELKWWNAQTGEFIKKVTIAKEGVRTLDATWSPAGDLIALAERRSERQLTQFSEVDALRQRRIYPRSISFEETELKLLDARTGERRLKLEDAHKSHEGNLARLYIRLERPVFSSDGMRVAALTGEQVTVWDVATGRRIVRLKKFSGWPTAIAISEDGKTLAVASVKGSMPGGESEISVWDVADGTPLKKLKGKNDSIACLQFAAHGRALLIGSLQYEQDAAAGALKLWDLRENRLGKLNVRADEAVSSLTPIPNRGAVVVQAGSDVELRDAKSFAVRYAFDEAETDENESIRRSRFVLTANRAQAVTFSADGTSVSAEIPGEGIRVWDVRTGELKNRIPRQESSSEPITFPNGGLIAEVSAEDQGGRIQVRDANTKKLLRTIDVAQKITTVATDPAGRLLAAALADYSIAVWDLKTGALQFELRKHQDTINALAFSPDGQTLASGGDDRTAILWDHPSG
ncbi:MAG TPA: hypothetical protein VGK82_14950, partial [Pyrinomonadaceae bacterium]